MKRILITAAAIYLLYDRQRRVERRLKLWKLRTEADLRRGDEELVDGCDARRMVEEINGALGSNSHSPQQPWPTSI
jgi:hypothetical protein